MDNYDAIIIGAGIAGLSLGSELSKKHKVLIIEKNQIKKEHKTWTTEKRIINEANLNQFVLAYFKKFSVKILSRQKNILNSAKISGRQA